MNLLPANTVLGELRLTEVYVDYDGPRVFSCRALTGQDFVAGWAEDGADYDAWLYLPISPARLAMVRSGGISLREAFERPEGLVYRVVQHVDEALPDLVEPLPGSRLLDEWLPEPDFRLELTTHTLPPMDPPAELLARARQESRARMRIEIDLPNYSRSEAPTRRVGELLLSTQSLYDNIGLALLEAAPPQAGRFPEHVALQTATDVVGLAAASLVIEIASNQTDDLFGDSVFARITEKVVGLLNPRLERNELVEELSELRARGARSFRTFVKSLADTGGSVSMAGAGSATGYVDQALSADAIASLYRILSSVVPEEVLEIRGPMRLYAANLESHRFGALDETANERYEGRISKRALPRVDHAELNAVYEMLIIDERTIDEGTGETKASYTLEQLTPAGDKTRGITVTRIAGPEGVPNGEPPETGSASPAADQVPDEPS